MVDINIRKALDELAKDKYPDKEIIILDNPSFDKSIIGLIGEEDPRLVYDYDSMCEEMCNDDGIDLEDAVEFIDYNTMRALPYMGENAPLIMVDTKHSIMDIYGTSNGGCDDWGGGN